MADPVYEVVALKYAHHDRHSRENFLVEDPHDALQPLAYYVWVITGAGRTILVDTGFDETMARRRRRTIVTPVPDGLRALGVVPESIGDIIFTHLHYDHCGNFAPFPRARFHVQDAEVAYATGRYMTHGLLRLPFEVEDVVALVRKVHAGQVVFHDGADEIAPGITVHKIGGHSRGLQCVRVNTARGPIVLASDCSHLYPHFLEGRVFPVTFNVGEVLEGYRTIRQLAGSDDHVVPGHDPAVLDLYPPVSPQLAGVAVRLDVAPRARAGRDASRGPSSLEVAEAR
jgi:glyoxylase-like metal-dependent hydrolase (beta-lactamase superfamily II)